MKSSEHRTIVYDYVEKLLGREITTEEHKQLRQYMIDMCATQTKPLFETIERLKNKVKVLGGSLHSLLNKKGIAEVEMQFLKATFAVFEATEPEQENEPT